MSQINKHLFTISCLICISLPVSAQNINFGNVSNKVDGFFGGLTDVVVKGGFALSVLAFVTCAILLILQQQQLLKKFGAVLGGAFLLGLAPGIIDAVQRFATS